VIRGLLSDDEWAFFAPFVIESGAQGGRPPTDHRRVLDAIFWITRAGAPWRDLPDALGNWNSVHRQFRRWTASGLWDVMLEALSVGGGDAALQMAGPGGCLPFAC
jgi:transposase